MENGGNDRVNKAFEAKLNVEKLNPESTLEERDAFIRSKYNDRAFLDPSRYQSRMGMFQGLSDMDLFSESKAVFYMGMLYLF